MPIDTERGCSNSLRRPGGSGSSGNCPYGTGNSGLKATHPCRRRVAGGPIRPVAGKGPGSASEKSCARILWSHKKVQNRANGVRGIWGESVRAYGSGAPGKPEGLRDGCRVQLATPRTRGEVPRSRWSPGGEADGEPGGFRPAGARAELSGRRSGSPGGPEPWSPRRACRSRTR
jgi:hypothetical protein